MRKTFIVVGLGMILFACGGDDPPPPTSTPPPPTVDSEAAHKASELAADMAMTSLYVQEDKDKNAVARYLTQASSEGYMTSVMPEFEEGTGDPRVDSLSDFDLKILNDSEDVVAFKLLEDLEGEQGSENLLPGEMGRTFKSHPLEKRGEDRRSEANALISWNNTDAASDYLAMGYWYTKPTEADSKAELGAFVGGAEFASDPSYALKTSGTGNDRAEAEAAAADVEASYEGTARGYHTSEDGETGTFFASLDLTATFKGISTLAAHKTPVGERVMIEGVIGERGGIRFDGEDSNFKLRLNEVSLSCASDGANPANCKDDGAIDWKRFNGTTTMVNQTDGMDVEGSKGSWTGLFGKSDDNNTTPDYVGGTAGVTWNERSLLGAWIGHKQ